MTDCGVIGLIAYCFVVIMVWEGGKAFARIVDENRRRKRSKKL